MAAAFAVRYCAATEADDVSADEAARRRTILAQALPLRLRVIPPTDYLQALEATRLPTDQRHQVVSALKARPLRLAWLPVFDSDAEDGDIVTIRTLGLLQTVRLAKRIVAVPVLLGPDARIRVTGVDQGMGGGVTLGLVSNGVPLKLPPLAVGETISLDAIAESS